MKIIPYGKNILIKPLIVESPILNREKSLCEYGIVSEIGGDVKNVKIGDKIGFTIWGVNKLLVEDETYYFIPEDDRFILGMIEE